MNRTITLFLVMGAVTAACTAIPTTVEPTAVVPAATVTELATPIPTPTPIPTLSPTPELAPAPIYPTLVTLCPADPIVPLSELGLDPQTRLLVSPASLEAMWDENEAGLFVISPDDPTPRLFPHLFQSGMVNSSQYGVSSDGQWLIFNRKTINPESVTGWISSIDGEQQWRLSPTEELRVGYWLNDDTILLYDTDNELRKAINPFTMDEELLTDLPETTVTGIGSILFRSAGQTWMLYQAGYDYRLFNVSTRTDQQVLEWLSAADVPLLAKGISVATDGQISIKVVRPYGFDMSPLMRVSEVIASESYTQTMQPVFLPENILPAQPSWESTSTSAMSIYNDSEQNPNPAPQFYWFDYQQQIIKDYCFAPLGSASISLDGRFVAFTRVYLPSQSPAPKSIIILNLDTGYTAQIDDYRFVGWARADE